MELFSTLNYKDYLNSRLDSGGRGTRAKLAKAIGCQSAYTAQVLRGSMNFSLEQAETINRFFSHSELDSEYFIRLVLLARAGTKELRQRFEREIKSFQKKQKDLTVRLGVGQPLKAEEQQIYYSNWYYCALHAMASVPAYQKIDLISQRLQMPQNIVADAIDFLCRAGILVKKVGGGWEIGESRIHLGRDSSMIDRHHANWRLQAIRSLERKRPEDLHYSSVVSISAADREKIFELLMKAVEKAKAVVREAEPSEVGVINVDFFSL